MLIRVLVIVVLANFIHANMENYVNLIFAVQEYFTSGCIYLLNDHDEFLNASTITVEISKLMFRQYIQTTLSSKNGSKDCKRNRPLYVILDNESGYSRSSKRTSLQTAVWLKFLEKEKEIEFLKTKDIPFDCEFLIAAPKENGSVKYSLTEVYQNRPMLPFNTNHFGDWDPSIGLIHPQVGFYERRRSLHGAVLKTAVEPSPSMFIQSFQTDLNMQLNLNLAIQVMQDSPLLLSEDSYKLGHRKRSLFHEVWLMLRNIMNFTPVYLYPERNVHGMKLHNGSWNGLLGLIERKEAEISCEALTMSPSRAEVVDFMVPIKSDRQYVLIKKSDIFELNWNSFLLPFSKEIWLAVIITIFFLALMLWASYKISNYYCSQNSDTTSYKLHESLFFILGNFCQQGHDRTPISMSGRVVCLVSYLTAVVLLAGYSASLISYLTLRKPVIPFTTFAGLLKDSSYKFGLTPFSSIYSYFEETKDPMIHELYERFLHHHNKHLPPTTEDGVRRVCKEYKYTFLSSLEVLDNIHDELTCRIFPVSKAYIPGSRAMAVVKNSPYHGIFSHYLLKLRSAGILKRLELSTSRKFQEEEQLFVNMDILSVAPIFAIAATGAAAAIIVLLVEILIYKKCTKFNKREQQQNNKYHKEILKSVSFECKRRAHRETWKINFVYN